MERGTNEPVRLGFLDNFTSIHDGDSVGNALHHAQVVGNKQQGDAFFSLKVQQDTKNLRLHRDVERRHRLAATKRRSGPSNCPATLSV